MFKKKKLEDIEFTTTIGGHPADPYGYPDEKDDEEWLAERDAFQEETEREEREYWNRDEPEEEDDDLWVDMGEDDD